MTASSLSPTTTTTTTTPPPPPEASNNTTPSNKRQKTYKDYTFYRYEHVEEQWLSIAHHLPPETLCWVQQSRGKKRKNSKQLYHRARVVTGELLDGDRVLVRYAKGSTFRVRRCNLLPVLLEERLVVVAPETNLYRRWATIHTRPDDAFVEIGCDIGLLVQKVSECSSCPQYVTGLDKAEEDIEEGKKRFPHCNFRAWNVPLKFQREEEEEKEGEGKEEAEDDNKDNGKDQATTTTTPIKKGPPLPVDLFPPSTATMNPSLVVAIDINGNRELEAVKQCVEIVIQEWKPRLIVVKSRSLYADLLGDKVEGVKVEAPSSETGDDSE